MNPFYAMTVIQAELPPDGWPQSFAIVTACNPNGLTTSNNENAMLDARLKTQLENRRCWNWRVTGGSPDFHHAEPGFAVDLPLSDALLLGREFEQEAVFWIEEDEVTVIACQLEERQQVGSWNKRLAQGNSLKYAL